MNRKQIRERVETALQDRDNRHWTDAEINQYIDDTLVEFTRISKYPQSEGSAKNPGGTTPLGEATKTGTLTVDGKTATITFSSDHLYSANDVVVVSGGGPTEYNGAFPILKPSDTTLTYRVSSGDTVTDSSVSCFRIGPTFTKPTTIAEIVSASIDGRELSIYTESELNAAAASRGYRYFMLESSMGFHPNAFSSAITTIDNTPKWRTQTGPIEAIIFNNRTASTFRIYPLPKADKDLYVDKDATTKVFHTLSIRGVPVSSGLTSDTTSPDINAYWHEAIVYGSLERAWLKESKLQNVEKSNMYRNKFMEQANQAKYMEGMTSGALSEGRNQGGFRINRNL
ncbi:MAG TPA: hypothetical protein EYM55_05625 [Candidatus Marinimicrobia bacterium]|nr:hypothetical protein [Candidatus Neomarinimicrobiota bacterium]